MKSRTLSAFTPLLLLGLTTGCSVKVKPDKKKASGSGDFTKMDQEQNLQGTIAGQPWEFGIGRIEPNDFDTSLSIALVSGSQENVCEEFILKGEDGLSVLFAVEEDELQVSKFPLGVDAGRTVTLAADTQDGSENQFVLNGFFEFTDITDSTIAGKMAVNNDPNNAVSGTFDLVRCCKDETTGESKVCDAE
jgi:hypothetical protein